MFHIQSFSNRLFLAHEQQVRVEIFLFGALLNRYEIQEADGTWFNAIAGFADPSDAQAHITNGFRSAKLSPYACRLNQGRYTFANEAHQCRKHILGKHAIHGLMYDTIFTLSGSHADEQGAWVELHADYPQDDLGFPFSYGLTVRYTLTEAGLTIETTAKNTGQQAMPIVDGWHPYFTLGGKVDDWMLCLNSDTQLEFNEDLLPTGQRIVDKRFQAALKLQNIELDNCFVLNNLQDTACILQHNNKQLRIDALSHYPYLQIYIPPERTSIAIENLSGAPDAFNNKIGLHILEPQQSILFATRYALMQAA